MTPVQRDAILKVIDEDAEIGDIVCDDKDRMCIMGGLLHSAGVPIERLRGKFKHWWVTTSDDVGAETSRALLKRVFGLEDAQQCTLVGLNDKFKTRPARQRALCKQVKSWKVSDA